METIPVYLATNSAGGSIDQLFLRRSAAYLLDFLPLLLLIQIFLYLACDFSPLASADQEIAWNGEQFSEARFARTIPRYAAFLLWLVYSAIFEASAYQATPGKRLLGLKVTDSQGKRLTFAQSCWRNGWKLFSYLPFGLGFLYLAFDPQQQTWHGRISGTFVVGKK